jgi:two-component system nitrogen regulation response regulator NtrX
METNALYHRCELRNAVERLMLLATSDEVTAETVALALPASFAAPDSISASAGPLADRVRAFEKQTILAELKRNHHQIANTARALGLERSHLYKKAEQVGIDLKAERNEVDRGGH